MSNIIYSPNTKTFDALKQSGSEPVTLIFVDSDVASNKELIKGLRKEIPLLDIKVLNYSTMPVEFERNEYTNAFFNSLYRSINYIHIDEFALFSRSQSYIQNDKVCNIIVDSSTFIEFKDNYLNTFVQTLRTNESLSTPTTLAVRQIMNRRLDFAESLETILSTGADVSKVAKILQKLK